MSDTVLKLIPVDPRHVPRKETRERALELFAALTGGWEPEVKVYDQLQFVDPGEWIKAIVCPRCGARLDLDGRPEHETYFEWYHEVLEQEEEHGAEPLQVQMPCCGATVPFTEVRFIDGGFSLFELQVSDPESDCPMAPETLAKIEQALGCPLRQIWARY